MACLGRTLRCALLGSVGSFTWAELIPRLHGLCRMVELVNVSCWASLFDLLELN